MCVFHVLFWNADGLRSKLAKLRNFVINNPVHFILIQEVHTAYFRDLNIKNFKSYFNARTDNNVTSPYGGTAIFMSRRVTHVHIPSLPLNLF